MGEYFPKISVIVPVYNCEKYIKHCLVSIIKQSYKNFEVIIIDDGSEDQSGVICDNYAKNHKNIRVIHNKNQGPAASRKCGIENADGNLVMFVDSDDWLEPDALEEMCRELLIFDVDIVTCCYADINNRKRIVRRTFQEDALKCNSFSECIYEIHGTRRMATGPVAKLYKKYLFENIDFREHITIGEDYTMLLQVLQNANMVRMLNRVFYNRRIYGGNISRSGYTHRHKPALDNYLLVRKGLIDAFPQYKTEILGYHIEYEMAVITAMCRNRHFDRKVVQKLRDDLSWNMKEILWKCKIPTYMKICAFMIAYTPKLFCACFILLNKLTGR